MVWAGERAADGPSSALAPRADTNGPGSGALSSLLSDLLAWNKSPPRTRLLFPPPRFPSQMKFLPLLISNKQTSLRNWRRERVRGLGSSFPVNQSLTSAWDRRSHHRVSVPDLLGTKKVGALSQAGMSAREPSITICTPSLKGRKTTPFETAAEQITGMFGNKPRGQRDFRRKHGEQEDCSVFTTRGWGTFTRHTLCSKNRD